jgi:hypothetical protein
VYYQDDLVTIYHGDCREILPLISQPEVVITDPVWPNSVFPGIEPFQLFEESVGLLRCKSLVVHLGVISDPRFLSCVPDSLPFFRVCWLRYAHPSFVGRVLMGGDVAYVFGEPPPSSPGKRVLAGECTASNNTKKDSHTGRGHGSSSHGNYDSLPHPTPRRYEHVRWLVAQYGLDSGVLDPFSGTGTTLRACKDLMIPSIGIEVEERYCEIAAKRMAQDVLPF